MTDPIVSQILLGVLVAYILQALKHASWFPVLTEQSAKLWKVTLSGFVAIVSSLGLGYSYDQVAGTVLITGVSIASLWNALTSFGVSFVAQHSAYEVLINKPGFDEVKKPMRKYMTSVVLATVVLASSGCSLFNDPTTKPLMVKFDVGCLTAVQTIAQVEKDLAAAGLLAPTQSLAIRKALSPVIDLGTKATDALIAWKPGDVTPAALLELSTKLTDLTTTVIAMLPDGDAKSQLLSAVSLAHAAWSAVIRQLASQGGA